MSDNIKKKAQDALNGIAASLTQHPHSPFNALADITAKKFLAILAPVNDPPEERLAKFKANLEPYKDVLKDGYTVDGVAQAIYDATIEFDKVMTTKIGEPTYLAIKKLEEATVHLEKVGEILDQGNQDTIKLLEDATAKAAKHIAKGLPGGQVIPIHPSIEKRMTKLAGGEQAKAEQVLKFSVDAEGVTAVHVFGETEGKPKLMIVETDTEPTGRPEVPKGWQAMNISEILSLEEYKDCRRLCKEGRHHTLRAYVKNVKLPDGLDPELFAYALEHMFAQQEKDGPKKDGDYEAEG